MGLLFYPRGGSAQVARYLAAALAAHGHRATLAVGSLGPPGSLGHAETFFDGLRLVVAAYDDAVAAWKRGDDPMSAPMPMHPSFEAKPGVPDRCFGEVAPELGNHAAAAWGELFAASRAFTASELLHLHHLGPLHAAARQALSWTARGHSPPWHRPEVHRSRARGGGPHGAWWVDRMTEQARGATATICISPHDRDEAVRLLGIDPETIEVVPNGVDVERFAAARVDGAERLEAWHRWLADDPLAWTEEIHAPGALRATAEQVPRRVPRSFRGAEAGAALRGPLPRLQAGAAPRSRLRPGAAGAADRGSTRGLGRLARRVGERASGHRGPRVRPARRRPERLLRRLARSRGASARSRVQRRVGGPEH